MAPAALEVQQLGFGYSHQPVLKEVGFRLPQSHLVGIVGANGCGKSTLLSLLAGLLRPNSGRIELAGRELSRYSRRHLAQTLAYLPQSPSFPRGIKVHQVLSYGRQPYQNLWRQLTQQDRTIIAETATRLHLEPLLDRPMEALSGGQRQRVWLAMSLIQQTPVILLDEPTSALDLGHQEEVLRAIRSTADQGKTVAMVIHDMAAACRFCHSLLVLHRGQVVASGPPATTVTAPLVKEIFGIDAQIYSCDPHSVPVAVPQSM